MHNLQLYFQSIASFVRHDIFRTMLLEFFVRRHACPLIRKSIKTATNQKRGGIAIKVMQMYPLHQKRDFFQMGMQILIQNKSKPVFFFELSVLGLSIIFFTSENKDCKIVGEKPDVLARIHKDHISLCCSLFLRNGVHHA